MTKAKQINDGGLSTMAQNKSHAVMAQRAESKESFERENDYLIPERITR